MKSKNPVYLPAYLGEKAQYLAHESNDNTIRIALFYERPLQAELLHQATMDLIRRIDILHAGFCAGKYTAKWNVNREFQAETAFTSCLVKSDIRDKVHKVMLQSIPFDGILQLHCTLVSNGTECAIVLTVGHMCADGRDAEYLLEKLLELYNCLLNNEDTSQVPLKNGSRNPEQCCTELTLKDRIRLYSSPVSEYKTAYIYPDNACGNPRIIYRTLPSKLMASARKKGKEYHASINDLLLTAFYRAAAKQMELPQGQGMGIQSMIDLRRRMPDGDSLGICNLSGSLPTELKDGVNGTFADTLKEIVAQTSHAKCDPLAGLYDFPIMSGILRILPFSMIQKLGAKIYGGATMSMTNLGALNAEKCAAGGILPSEAILGAPLKKKPAFQLAVLGLNGNVCISVTAVCTERDETQINDLLKELQAELECFCNAPANQPMLSRITRATLP